MRSIALAVVAVLACGCAATETSLHTRTAFFVGGRYVGDAGKEVVDGQMYVEVLSPARITHRYPLILIHGAAQTGVGWITTPDNRPGWADYFLSKGYRVVVVDQPRRGRSAWHPATNLALRSFNRTWVELLFTSPKAAAKWPQAANHSQWAGDGQQDAEFEQFMASQVEFVGSNPETQRAMQQAGVKLLERLGPSIIVAHSQAGPFAWLIADELPANVKGIVAIEPQGPPLQEAVLWNNRTRPWGLTDIPLTYDGERTSTSPIVGVLEEAPEAPDLVKCWRQAEPAKKLTRLEQVPVMVLVGDASYHTPYDHCTARWLKQGGVNVEFVRLSDKGIHGNGHMMMLERNSDEVAAVVETWIRKLD